MKAPRAARVVVAVLGLAGSCAPRAPVSKPSVAAVSLGREGTTVCLNADGPGGRDAYELIESVLGAGSVESPDADHPTPFRHVSEAIDGDVGAHFVFSIHRDTDRDRGRIDRQRMEIKVFDASDESLKARHGSAFTYTWRVKLGRDMAVSRKATHLFQLKGVGGDDRMPLVTLTGAKRPHGDRLELRHTTGGPSMTVLADTDFAPLRDEWLDVRCQATFAEGGSLAFTVTRPNGQIALDVHAKDLDLWRNGDFVRPKWGIYRGLLHKEELRADEERVGFANFAVTPGFEPTSDCR